MDFKRLEPSCLEALLIAQSLAVRRGHPEVRPEHLLLALMRQPLSIALDVLARLGTAPDELSAPVESSLERAPSEYSKDTRLSQDLECVLAAAERWADERGSGAITVRHLLAGLATDGGTCAELLRARSITPDLVLDVSPSTRGPASPASAPGIRDLTREAAKSAFPPILGRDETLARIFDILDRQRHYPLLLGEKGVGRGALVQGLAQALAARRAPSSLAGASLLALDGAVDVDALVRELPNWTRPNSNVLLYLKDPRALAQTIRALRDFPDRGRVGLIGRSTPEEYFGTLSRQHYLEGCLETVNVRPLCAATTVLVLRGLRPRFEARRDVEIGDDAIETATDLAQRLLAGAQLPGAALGVLDEAAAWKRAQLERVPRELENMEAQVAALQAKQPRSPRLDEELSELRTAAGWLRARWEQEKEAEDRASSLRHQLRQRPGDELLARRLKDAEDSLSRGTTSLVDRRVTGDDVALGVERRSDARLGGLALEARPALGSLEGELGRDVLGQRPAVRSVTSTLMRASTRLEITGGVGASFLFVGPPGVGKAAMARSLAAHFLDDETAFATLSCDDATKLLNVVSKTPRLVVMVRDVHRASPAMQRLVTRVLERGAFSGNGGRTDFRQTLLVLSTHGEKPNWLLPLVDGMVGFGPLNADIAKLIADRECRALSDRLSERRIALEWSGAAVEWLAVSGFSRQEGVHRLHRLLTDEIGSRLGRMLVLGELSEGSRALVDLRDGRIEVTPLSQVEQAAASAALHVV